MTDGELITPREQVSNALFDATARIAWRNGPNAKNFVTRGRRQKPLLNFPPADAPALFQVSFNEDSDQTTDLRYKNAWHYRWIVYNAVTDESADPSTEIDRILTALFAAVAPAETDPGFPFDRNTLGGLCHHAYIKGQIIKDPGDLDGWGLLVVPIVVVIRG